MSSTFYAMLPARRRRWRGRLCRPRRDRPSRPRTFPAPRRWLAASALWLALGAALSGCSGPPSLFRQPLPMGGRQSAADGIPGVKTFYEQSRELESLLAAAPKMTTEEQRPLAERMTEIVRRERNPLLRKQAVRVLGALNVPEAAIGLNMASTDSDVFVREETCAVLGKKRDRPALETLTQMLSGDEAFDVRMAAAREIGNYRDKQAYQALFTALQDSDPAMQRRARESLRQASGVDLGGDLEAWRQLAETGSPPESYRPPSWAQRLGQQLF